MLKIGVLLGDDIGLEVVPEAVKVMKAAAKATGLEVQWQELPIGKRGHELHGHTLPQPTVAALEKLDGFAMKLVMAPQQYDVVVTTNQFGDILTDEGAGLVGGLGLAPGLCIGERQAMAQATHGSAPDIAGRNIANPYALIISGKMLLEWLGRKRGEARAVEAARRIDAAVDKVIAGAKHLTRDLGGSASTTEMGDAIAAAVLRKSDD